MNALKSVDLVKGQDQELVHPKIMHVRRMNNLRPSVVLEQIACWNGQLGQNGANALPNVDLAKRQDQEPVHLNKIYVR